RKSDVSEEPKEIALPVTIPDTITEWKAGAFCLSADAGFGLPQPTFLKAFQPFFIELTLPYSVVQGEDFPLKASVFSYLTYCILIKISLSPSADFEASPIEEEENSYCICANGRKMVSWMMTPKILGKINFTASAEAVTLNQLCGNEVVEVPTIKSKDVVIKSLLVESKSFPLTLPENVVEGSTRASFCVLGKRHFRRSDKEPQSASQDALWLWGTEHGPLAPNIYILNYLNKTGQLTQEIKSKAIGYLEAGEPESKSFPLTLPENVVEGSTRASFCVLGDILGGVIKNLNQLLKMPYGCGEQNMALFAPNIYILNYLNKTGQLTQEIKSKAIGYLEAGYQRQLKYKHPDGSYSTFGKAFVLKSFARARSIIFVEDKHINDAQNSLTLRQENTGCFQSNGSFFNNALKGGVDDQSALSTYITISLLEVPLPPTATEAKEIHIYLRALLAYAFALAGKEEKRQEMLDSLLKVAVEDEDGSIHWERPGKQKQRSDFLFYFRAPSAVVEMTSYGLLAFLTKKPSPSQEELMTATAIVKWLPKQQNSNGGYSSTQSDLEFRRRCPHTIPCGQQQLSAAPVPGSAPSARAEVTGCIFMQTALKYNVPLRQEDAPFRLDVHTVPETCTGNKAHVTFDIAMSVSYTGQRLVSNMAIVKINMLSGYIPEKSSIKQVFFPQVPFSAKSSVLYFLMQFNSMTMNATKALSISQMFLPLKLEKQGQIQKSEVNINHVLLYLDEVRNTSQTFSFTVEQETPVRGLKPALVKVYDYYETDDIKEVYI
ncbi:hypothetical protein E2320_014332, partial [Naja naja]